LLWVPPVPRIGAVIYRKVADSRMCSIRKAVPPKEDKAEDPKIVRWIAVVGSVLVGMNVLFGFAHLGRAWPFACYPTFAGITEKAEIQVISFVGVMNEKEELIDISSFKKQLPPQKYAGLIEAILKEENEKRKVLRLSKLVDSMQQAGVDFNKYSQVRFYKTIRSTVPEKYSDGPLSSELLFEMDVAGK
jgi:hypothetical protein